MNSGIEELIKQIHNKPYIENVKEMLHELNFEFMDSDTVETFQDNKNYIVWSHKSDKKYQWMVRRYRHKTFIGSKIDWDLMVGIRFMDYRAPRILIYTDGSFLYEIQKPWKVPIEVNAKKKKIPLTFPDEMSIQDRIDWRKSHKRFSSGKSLGKEELRYYLRFKPLIGNLDKEFDHLS